MSVSEKLKSDFDDPLFYAQKRALAERRAVSRGIAAAPASAADSRESVSADTEGKSADAKFLFTAWADVFENECLGVSDRPPASDRLEGADSLRRPPEKPQLAIVAARKRKWGAIAPAALIVVASTALVVLRYGDALMTGAFFARVSTGLTPKMALAIAEVPAQKMGAAVPLGINVGNPRGGGLVVIRDVGAGATLSVGDPAGPDSWWLSAARLDGATLTPPEKFVGEMRVRVELRDAHAALLEEKTQLYKWTGAEAAAPKSDEPAQKSDAGRMSAAWARASKLIAEKDLAAARLVLKPLADGGDGAAAMKIAETYDPALSQKLAAGERGDIAMARRWHETARRLGVTDAAPHLSALATNASQ